jgi:PAS domain S-box-containing protein
MAAALLVCAMTSGPPYAAQTDTRFAEVAHDRRCATDAAGAAWRADSGAIVPAFLAGALVTGLLLFGRERRRSPAERDLQDSVVRFRGLTELASDWYWEQDPRSTIVFTSARYEADDGLRMPPAVGRTRWELDNLWESDEHLQSHKATLDAHLPFRDLYLRRRDKTGELRHFLISGVPVFDASGRFAGYRGIGREVTQQWKTSESLRDSERRIETVINNIPATIGYWDDRTRLVFGNRAMEGLFGAPLDRLVGRTLRDILGDEAYKVAAPHVEAVLRGEPRTFERTAPPPEGPPRRLQIQVVPDLGDGRVKGFFALTTDITELSDLVEERTRDLNAAKQRAEAASRAKDDFLANVSHEMRTPLHAIKAFTSLSLRRIDHASDDKLSRFLKNTDDSARRLYLFVEDLLALAKHQAGQHPVLREPVDLVERIATVRRHLEALLAARELVVDVRADTRDPVVPADAGMIEQVVTNLLSNAIKFSPEGGIISLRLADDAIALGGGRSVPALALSVSDRGMGIPETELESIFNKFEQSSRTKTGAGGTGLGLAICREIAARHGGHIVADNNPEGGATFVVRLPRVVPALEEREGPVL